MAGKQDVIGSDGLSDRFERCPDAARLSSILFVELSPLQGAGEECLQSMRVALLTLTLPDARSDIGEV